MTKRILIAGGGAIGLFSAYYLQKAGHDVTVADKSDMTDGCSYGNAGLIVPSHIIPLASPGMASTAFKFMFNPAAPVGVKMPPSLNFLKWSVKFLSAANKSTVERSSHILKELSLLSKALYKDFLANDLTSVQFDEKGLLIVNGSKKVHEEETGTAQIANDLGVEAIVLSKDEVLDMEPALSDKIEGGVFYPGDCSLSPPLLMNNLLTFLDNLGVTFFKNAVVDSISKKTDDRVEVVINDKSFLFDEVVVAAGVWSNDLLSMVGKEIPLQPGRGYSFDVVNQDLRYPALLIDERVSVTPFPDGKLRFGGGMELGYFGKNIFQKRLRGIYDAARSYYPNVALPKIQDLRIWQGHRPCSFDGLPYIGKLPGHKNIFLATGHSMMGITLAPATGKLISELVDGNKTSMDIFSLRINR